MGHLTEAEIDAIQNKVKVVPKLGSNSNQATADNQQLPIGDQTQEVNQVTSKQDPLKQETVTLVLLKQGNFKQVPQKKVTYKPVLPDQVTANQVPLKQETSKEVPLKQGNDKQLTEKLVRKRVNRDQVTDEQVTGIMFGNKEKALLLIKNRHQLLKEDQQATQDRQMAPIQENPQEEFSLLNMFNIFK